MNKKYSFSLTEQLLQEIETADAIVIGAGAGLSASAGFVYSGERFRKYFSDFEEKYDFHDMYSGGFYPYETLEEYWAYWSRYIQINRYENAPKPIYEQLFRLVSGKNYFVITTNVDHCFQKADFDKKRLFYTQGDYGLFQCSEPCHNQTYDNQEWISRMVNEQKDMRIPTNLIPLCPQCQKPMTMNLRSDEHFAEDEGWKEAADRYTDFLRRYGNSHILFLEIGVGYNTPEITKKEDNIMTQSERRLFLINSLIKEMPQYQDIEIPHDESQQWNLLRSLFNVRPPFPAFSSGFNVIKSWSPRDMRKQPERQKSPPATTFPANIFSIPSDRLSPAGSGKKTAGCLPAVINPVWSLLLQTESNPSPSAAFPPAYSAFRRIRRRRLPLKRFLTF